MFQVDVTSDFVPLLVERGQSEQADGSLLKIDTDYFGKRRSDASPTAGPLENPGAGDLKLKVW